MAATILVVEDEPAIQELIACNLELAGHQALRAENAEQALDMVRSALPDLVVLDWMLPGMSGIEFARKLRADKRTQEVPVIMLTARADEADKLNGLESGADDYLVKPFSPRELNARVKRYCSRRAPQATDDLVETAGLQLDPVSHRVNGNQHGLSLGPTEFRLLHFFMTHPNVSIRVLTSRSCLGRSRIREERTVDVHIRRLRKALEPTGHDRLIQTVRSAGYRFFRRFLTRSSAPVPRAIMTAFLRTIASRE